MQVTTIIRLLKVAALVTDEVISILHINIPTLCVNLLHSLH